MAPDYLSLWRRIGSMRLGGSGRTQINPVVMVSSHGDVAVHHHSFLLPFGSACAYLTTADASAPRLAIDFYPKTTTASRPWWVSYSAAGRPDGDLRHAPDRGGQGGNDDEPDRNGGVGD